MSGMIMPLMAALGSRVLETIGAPTLSIAELHDAICTTFLPISTGGMYRILNNASRNFISIRLKTVRDDDTFFVTNVTEQLMQDCMNCVNAQVRWLNVHYSTQTVGFVDSRLPSLALHPVVRAGSMSMFDGVIINAISDCIPQAIADSKNDMMKDAYRLITTLDLPDPNGFKQIPYARSKIARDVLRIFDMPDVATIKLNMIGSRLQRVILTAFLEKKIFSAAPSLNASKQLALQLAMTFTK
jgi:hypothetical protein